ncbi:cell division protein FtsZ [Pelagibius litoralis]|uniref:Cell division protein FtsZ n=1 Tax=Pelagibius litoralis TaxID=374515 RepID=A0A967EVG3_9PROT|nr:cell division protein FtsZ [Pelagibius litoralis]NIA68631.1 cell division protein FtsZ [Pelagibius litoralis]
MTLNLNVPSTTPDLSPRITVIGVGGAGGNAVNNMIQTNLEGVEFLICNTDSQALSQSLCERRIQLGRNITQGLGAGSRPDIGRAAAEEALDDILTDLEGQHMCFITAGMGGGTGTGAGPVIARAAREAGILTVGVVTKPFHFEGVHRMRLAESGINELTQYVDTLIIIPNQNLFRVANEKTTFADAFKMADDVLNSGVRGVTDLMVNPGMINLDFADIRAVMSEMGKAMMGTGEAEGENRAIGAAEAAISNPLLDDVSMKGARGVLINITGGMDLTLFEVDEAANRIRDEVDPEANIIFGSTFDQSMEGRMRVSVVSTGIDVDAQTRPKPITLSLVGGQKPPALPTNPSGAEQPAAATAAMPNPAPAQTGGAHGGLFAGAPGAQMGGGAMAGAAAVALEQPAPMSLGQTALAQPEPEPMATPAPVAESSPAVHARAEADSFIAPPPMMPESDPADHQIIHAEPDPFAEAAIANAVRPDARTVDTRGEAAAPTKQDTKYPSMGEPATAPAPASRVAAEPAPKRSGQSLFAKVTGGAARALQAATQGTEAAARSAQPSPQPMPQPRPMPARGSGVAQPQRETPAPAPAQPAAAPAAQPNLSGLDPAERIGQSQAEEDLLDIPAFLRRQAN